MSVKRAIVHLCRIEMEQPSASYLLRAQQYNQRAHFTMQLVDLSLRMESAICIISAIFMIATEEHYLFGNYFQRTVA